MKEYDVINEIEGLISELSDEVYVYEKSADHYNKSIKDNEDKFKNVLEYHLDPEYMSTRIHCIKNLNIIENDVYELNMAINILKLLLSTMQYLYSFEHMYKDEEYLKQLKKYMDSNITKENLKWISDHYRRLYSSVVSYVNDTFDYIHENHIEIKFDFDKYVAIINNAAHEYYSRL